ncbi:MULTISPECIES: DUF6998 domain-containing protein [unclassified Leifsonia]|uniref:DUF6998 domain-containing protein n=1 Tax=unclassified Leifsonia TaxID=2663824 RepID=UPI0006F3241A|nr:MULTISPECIES: hypothetical protein [unclassified Leifsonia]KQX08178.1 hypothetical protein ASC59_10970 [Leifsonia sp. Root1293]KRA12460.1 hypothetical protein ASD61_10970 [Leifsonia sp. Root60]
MADDDLSVRSSRELLGMYARILKELMRREVIRTLNAPAGDLAEALVTRAYGGVIAPNSEKSYDVRAADGRLLQVKARVIASTARTKPIQFSVFRSWDFDSAIFIVMAAEDYEVLAAIEVPMASVRDRSAEVAWVGGSRLAVSLVVLAGLPGAVDRTREVRDAFEDLDSKAIGADGPNPGID